MNINGGFDFDDDGVDDGVDDDDDEKIIFCNDERGDLFSRSDFCVLQIIISALIPVERLICFVSIIVGKSDDIKDAYNKVDVTKSDSFCIK